MLNPPDGTAPRQVNVHDEADWQMIYKTPSIRVKCLVEECDTLLTPKRMSRSGLRFLAIRSGGCAHNLVKIQVLDREVEQDPSALVGGGGPEGVEHLWVKGRLFRIGRVLGLDPIEEDGLTRADVLLAKPKIALEYQRWDTDFAGRTEQRAQAGAKTTIWLFPARRPDEPWTKRTEAFRKQVWEAGGIYLSVKNHDDRREHLMPWENAAQEQSARLYLSGSIVKFDEKLGHLVRTELSITTVLAQIATGERALHRVPVFTKKTGKISWAMVWVTYGDYRATAAIYQQRAQAKADRDRQITTPAVQTQPPTSPAAEAREPTQLSMAEADRTPEAPEAPAEEPRVATNLQQLLLPRVPPSEPIAEPRRDTDRSQERSRWWAKLVRLFRER